MYGVFSWHGVDPIHLITDTMTALTYKHILETVMLWSFMFRKRGMAIPLETCRKLISSKPNRMQKIIQNKGRHCGY